MSGKLGGFHMVLLGLMWLCSGSAFADQLVYTPVNPTFGGNPANASGLQANASAQNTHKAPTDPPLTALEKFNQQLQSAILNRLTSNALSTLFSSDKLLSGSQVVVGDFTVSLSVDKNGYLSVTTAPNNQPGSSTTIVVGKASDFQQ